MMELVVISQSFVINQFNKGIECVDQGDQKTATYQIAIKTKRWWRVFFPWITDMLLQNMWIFET